VKVVLKLYATLSDYLPVEARNTNRIEIDVEPGVTVNQIVERQRVPARMAHLVLINGVFVPPGERASQALHADDELAIWPPVAGG
jgi:sulfur carrier protein ThiS